MGITKEGMDGFAFEVQGKTHKFEASSAAERDSWIVALEKQVEESKATKDEITGKDSYKKNVEEYCKFSPITSQPLHTMIDD